MLYLVGVNHSAQHRGLHSSGVGASALESTVRRLCNERLVAVIAEEFSADACARHRVQESLCCSLAREYGLVHLYCDPDLRERADLGIPTYEELVDVVKAELGRDVLFGEDSRYFDRRAATYNPIRESFWLSKLTAVRANSVLFVCGADHVETFSALLVRDSWEVGHVGNATQELPDCQREL